MSSHKVKILLIFILMNKFQNNLNKMNPIANGSQSLNGAAVPQHNGVKPTRFHDESYPEFRPTRPLTDSGQVTKLPPIPEANTRLKTLPPLPSKPRALPPPPTDTDSMDLSQLIQSHRRLKAAQMMTDNRRSSDGEENVFFVPFR